MATNLGNTCKFTTPSGFELTIRETDGEDDGIISKLKHAVKGDSVNLYIASIVLNKGGNKVSSLDVQQWKNRDRYYTLLKSRIHSLGSEISYKHTCSGCDKETIYEEELSQYDRDLSQPIEDTSNGFKYQILPYEDKDAKQVEFSTSSGRKLRYLHNNGNIEKKLLEMSNDEADKNTELTVRNLEWFNSDTNQWQALQNFKGIPSKEMAEIRNHMHEYDSPFDAISDCKCPFCGKVDKITLLGQPDFFFPGETS